MTTGSSLDIVGRVKRLIPLGWFTYAAPYRDAILGGLADLASWNYGLVIYARAQSRLATAYGIWLDILAFDFLGRSLTRSGLDDNTFRALIKSTILQERVTRSGMINALTTLTTTVPTVFEPWNTFDTGAYSGGPGGDGKKYGSMGYGIGRGGYGNMNLPGQVFIKVTRGSNSGIPGVGGYSNNIAGYGVGSIEYAGPLTELSGVTNDTINKLINITKPTGTTAWVQIGPVAPLVRRPCIFNSPNAKADSQNLAAI
jgi:hypothetical protein